ncbi:hypothetical protein FIBSPDRAFT_392456 [Athelia psychrophila]|uniref:F-box domain-containing protein n=1 Tax=Athelia psychrophila TaxID=1759441 RepID=A0A167V3N8_9AGAM|nr:hypothetical protein FIBSPDRAFT_392456 [Fibularhizoctonia sp. CBS 109695]
MHIESSVHQRGRYLSFTGQIARKPELAQRIRILSLPERLDIGLSEDQEQLRHRLTGLLPSALKLMNNLTSLLITPHRYIPGTVPTPYLHGDLFVGCSFRLKIFRSTGIHIPIEIFLPFFLEQSQIRDLEIGYSVYNLEPNPDFPTENLLLNLSVISTYYDPGAPFLSTVIASRRLTRLKLKMNTRCTQGDIENVMQAFVHAPASTTLTHLYFHFGQAHGPLGEVEHVKVLDSVSRALPKLQFLRYSDLVVSV